MSNHLILSFCEIENEKDVLKKSLHILDVCRENEEFINVLIKNIAAYIKYLSKTDKQNQKLIFKNVYLESFIRKYFRLKFVYFKKIELFAVCCECNGEYIPVTCGKYNKEDFPVTVTFDISININYDLSVWKGISYFESISDACMRLPEDKLIEHLEKNGFSKEMINKDLLSCRRMYVYKKIISNLHLLDYINLGLNDYQSTEYFDKFSMSLINSSFDTIDFTARLKKELMKDN